jgi:glycosyltransferase involved in cell wall biosynthesis
LPTLNENFGHAIVEALGAGCPVLISDQTAWRHLEQSGGGWDVPLDRHDRFGEIIAAVTEMNAIQTEKLRMNAWRYAVSTVQTQNAIDANRALFQQFRAAGTVQRHADR